MKYNRSEMQPDKREENGSMNAEEIETERRELHYTANQIKDREIMATLNRFAQAVYVGGYTDRKVMCRIAVRCLQALGLNQDEATSVYLVMLRTST